MDIFFCCGYALPLLSLSTSSLPLSFHEQNREIRVYASTFYNLIVLLNLNLLIIVDRIGEQGSTDEWP